MFHAIRARLSGGDGQTGECRVEWAIAAKYPSHPRTPPDQRERLCTPFWCAQGLSINNMVDPAP
jgi:hypothetical protein